MQQGRIHREQAMMQRQQAKMHRLRAMMYRLQARKRRLRAMMYRLQARKRRLRAKNHRLLSSLINPGCAPCAKTATPANSAITAEACAPDSKDGARCGHKPRAGAECRYRLQARAGARCRADAEIRQLPAAPFHTPKFQFSQFKGRPFPQNGTNR